MAERLGQTPAEVVPALPSQSPLFHAEHAERYQRQAAIRNYQETHHCRLIVVIDVLFPTSIAPLEELLYNADPSLDLHLILVSPGGDGETAVRMVRSIQARCKELTVIVPDIAKSAATILCLGAHRILMGPTSDLGPVDPQFPLPGAPGYVSAKDMIAGGEGRRIRGRAA
jgi:membrane-bound ClpP family serine protease